MAIVGYQTVGAVTTLPSADNSYNLGSTTLRWANIYGMNHIVAGTTSGTITITGAAAAGTWTMTLPTGGGTVNYVLTTDGTGICSWSDPGGLADRWSSLTNPTANLSLTMGTNTTTWSGAWTTQTGFTATATALTTGTLWSATCTSTALSGTVSVTSITVSGANTNTAVTAQGLSISVTNTNATSGTNIGLAVAASGANTANYAIKITGGTLAFILGAAATLGTYDANTLAVATNSTTRWTFASGSSNITAAGAADIIGQAATASMVRITDATTAFISVDSRTTTDNVVAVTIAGRNPTIAGVAGTTYSVHSISAVTFTTSTTTGITAMNGVGLNVSAPTLNQSGGAVIITTASTLYISGAPTAGASVTITNNYALHVAAGTTALQATTLLASPLNFTAGASFIMGTTDANTLAIKTGGTTRWTFAAGSNNLTAAAAADIIAPSATASALRVTDGTNVWLSIDTRTTTSAIRGVTAGDGSGVTIASAAGAAYGRFYVQPFTVTLTGTTTVTALNGIIAYFDQPTVTDASAETVTTASTVYIAGAPLAAGSVTITNNYALHVAAGTTFLAGTLLFTDNTYDIGASGANRPRDLYLARDCYTNNATFFIRAKTALTNGAGVSTGTLGNAPAATNPTKWIAIDDAGTTRQVPAW